MVGVAGGDYPAYLRTPNQRAANKEAAVQVLPEGQYIKHTVYGLGIVTEADSERTTIQFEGHGVKKFVTTLMSAEILGETPSKPIRLKRRTKKAATRR
jgi:hypothetical protein